MTETDDHILVQEVLQGNKNSFDVLVIRYQKKIYGMILQLTQDTEIAKDLTQDVFLRVYLNLSKFDFRYRFFSWLYRIALNESSRYLKRHRETVPLEKISPALSDPVYSGCDEMSSQILRNSLRKLKKEHRHLILLRYYFSLSYEEISEVLGISEKKVKDRLFNARNTLRSTLNQNHFFDND